MKPLGFLLSLLAHLLFLLLIVRIHFPVPETALAPQIIQIVPMSPPRPEPPPVYVRPFVLRGGDAGRASGGAAAGDTAPDAGARLPREPRRTAAPPAQPSPAADPPASGPGEAPASPPGREATRGGERPRFSADIERISRGLRSRPYSGPATPGAGLGGDRQAGIPFGDSPGGDGTVPGGGDGTASHALGGTAFFDARGYDITPWAKRVVYRIKTNWIFPLASGLGLKGVVGIYVLFERDGTLGSVYIRRASGIRPFDQAAFNAIELSAPLPPLPEDFPREELPAYLLFYYN